MISPHEGIGGRWAIGLIVLIHLTLFNESGGPGTIIAIIIAFISGIFSAICKSSVKNVQISYLKASHRFDFLCLFLSVWMDILSLLSACSILARTLSTSLDSMTGGMARMWILGRNSPANEPWPDVLGVAIVFLFTGMFMLGLENTRVFSFLMVLGVLGISGILSITTWLRGTSTPKIMPIFEKGLIGLLATAAINTFTLPTECPSSGGYRKLRGISIIFIVFISNILIAGCLWTLVEYHPGQEYIAVPIFSILELRDFTAVVPAVACLLFLACSGAFLELFPEMYELVVKLTTSEWKILAKQIGYENQNSGSPVLAIFTAGSLCAMLAFACPLQVLTHILAASHLCGICLRAFYLLYSPFRPKYIHQQNDSSLSYSRLNSGKIIVQSNSRIKRAISYFSSTTPTVSHNSLPKSKSKSKIHKKRNEEELEREWLLLGEPPSPRSTVISQDVESSILSDIDPPPSDIECIAKENTDSDSSTDIDAIVDEYRQKIKVSTAGPKDILILPTTLTWRISLIGISVILIGEISFVFATVFYFWRAMIGTAILVIFVSLLMAWLPKQQTTQYSASTIICSMSLLFGSALLIATLPNSWPAILFWVLAGIALFIRCDNWCCSCLDRPHHHSTQNLISNVSTSKLATIRLPARQLTKNNLITGRISRHR